MDDNSPVTAERLLANSMSTLISDLRGKHGARIGTDAHLIYRAVLMGVVGPDAATTARLARRVHVNPRSSALARAVEWRSQLTNGKQIHFPIVRKARSDKLDNQATQQIQEFWQANTACSPNARDIVRRRVGRQFIEHAVHHQYATTRELHRKFRDEFPKNHGSLGTFQAQKPFYIRAGKQTHVCVYCAKT